MSENKPDVIYHVDVHHVEGPPTSGVVLGIVEPICGNYKWRTETLWGKPLEDTEAGRDVLAKRIEEARAVLAARNR